MSGNKVNRWMVPHPQIVFLSRTFATMELFTTRFETESCGGVKRILSCQRCKWTTHWHWRLDTAHNMKQSNFVSWSQREKPTVNKIGSNGGGNYSKSQSFLGKTEYRRSPWVESKPRTVGVELQLNIARQNVNEGRRVKTGHTPFTCGAKATKAAVNQVMWNQVFFKVISDQFEATNRIREKRWLVNVNEVPVPT
jgi:hypothetical protein